MSLAVLPFPSRMLGAALVTVAALAAAHSSAARGEDKPHTVTFVNDSDSDLRVHVRTGSAGEVGSCEMKESQATFELRSKDRKPVESGLDTVCYCSRPSSEGPIDEHRDCAKNWRRAAGGEEVHLK